MLNKRSAGILLHISSLPSDYGIGDLGSGAYAFADFLHDLDQSWWQILPFNPTGSEFHHSPYSSHSAFAGNPLFISPEIVAMEGWISVEDLDSFRMKPSDKVNYRKVVRNKSKLLAQLSAAFSSGKIPDMADFFGFIEAEKDWLHDYALFMALKAKYKQKSWDKWPAAVRDREPEAIEAAEKQLEREILEQMLFQYIFYSQWKRLKHHLHRMNIGLIGDIPFYVNYDSADVWTHPHLFKLNEKKQVEAVSGVPPDYFCETGQLWGTPVYDWNALRAEGFEWWIRRIRQNLKVADKIRLDHFRAFSSYWEVDSGEETAMNGRWVHVPGEDIFDVFRENFPDMPFIAEDLGDIDQAVYDLIDYTHLPGMKILQYAFNKDMSEDIFFPHNHLPNTVAYTGTHDNLTLRAWFQSDAANIELLSKYAGMKVNKKNVHRVMARLALGSPANLAILPLQDILGTGKKSIMNKPGRPHGNWQWRIKMDALRPEKYNWFKEMTNIYQRKTDSIHPSNRNNT